MRPILEYGISVWSPHLRKHDKEIEQTQQRATRLIKGFEHYNYPEVTGIKFVHIILL